MTTTTDMRATVARELADAFETRKRDNGEKFWTLKDDAPGWAQPAVYSAHSDMMPDDYRYSYCAWAASELADTEPDEWDEIADMIEPDVYNVDRIAWLGSNLGRQYYCDTAAEEFGPMDLDIMQRIGLGQVQEMREVLGLIREAVEEEAEERA